MLGQGVYNRAYKPCPTQQDYMESEGNNPLILLELCPGCDRYFASCCSHGSETNSFGHTCHHFQVIFTDGGCPGNGTTSAQAGMGFLYGQPSDILGLSIPMSDVSRYIDIDPSCLVRTSQVAEVLAAILALNHYMREDYASYAGNEPIIPARNLQQGTPRPRFSKRDIVIASDSEYLVKGMTEWLPKWKRNGFRNSKGQPLSNKELFLKLDNLCKTLELDYKINVGFWHVPRAYNSGADKLAKEAARQDVISSEVVAEQYYAVSAWVV